MERLRLSAGALEAELLPGLGGALAALRWRHRGRMRSLLRETPGGARDVLQTACFPLVPFSNRVRNGRFGFRGREVSLDEALHGQGWRAVWAVVARDACSATLRFVHTRGVWPWAYEARQSFSLDPDGLTVTLSVTNRDSEAMPCGLGLHPYFQKDLRTVLSAAVGGVWRNDAELLPEARVAAIGPFDLVEAPMAMRVLDHGFDGWDGRATIRWVTHALRITAIGTERVQVYAPAGEPYFCFEPVTNATDAFNRMGDEPGRFGVAVLEPGEIAAIGVRFAPLGL